MNGISSSRRHLLNCPLQWLEAHGPFGVLIDGSNLALYGQNWAHGGFDFAQIGAAYDHAVAQFPDLKPLVVRLWVSVRVRARVRAQSGVSGRLVLCDKLARVCGDDDTDGGHDAHMLLAEAGRRTRDAATPVTLQYGSVPPT